MAGTEKDHRAEGEPFMKAWVEKKQTNKVAILGGVRTPFAKAGTKLKDCTAVHLGVTAMREALAKTDVAADSLDEVVFGNAGTPADAANISRVIALRSGTPDGTPAYTVHRNCASAMEAIGQGAMKIGSGLAETMVVGGTESMSNFPLLFGEEMTELFATLNLAKTSSEKLQKISNFRPGWLKPKIAIMEGLTDPVSGLNMGQTAEVLARDFHLGREEQDRYAVRSHQRTVEAAKAGRFEDEIFPTVLQPSYADFLATDIGPRDNQSLEALQKLRPFFDKENGTVTAGNACPVTDGAVALVMMNAEKAKSEGREILGTITGFAFTGCDPKRMGMGPIYSTSKVLEGTGLELADIDLVELNEAFAVQVLANQIAFNSKSYCVEQLGRKKELGVLKDEILNVNGGAIALGHPVGATGARLVLTLLLEMKRRNVHRGLATLCIGGGQGAAFIVERS
jgi:acetyl-CoA acetyltransferase family protein